MAENLSVYHERLDDVPLIIGVAKQLVLVEMLDQHLGTHGLQQGLNNGQLAVGWLTRLLTLALRLLTLIESQVRNGLAQNNASMTGLYEGQANRATARPSGKRLLNAFTRAQITLTCVVSKEKPWHMTPLSSRLQQVLLYLRLPPSLYAVASYNST